jgi:hypothetical protein
MIHSIEKQRFIIQPYESKILCCTSSLFLLPVIYAYSKNEYLYAVTSTGTFMFSTLYWIKPVHGWRRTIDMFYAKYSSILYFGSGVLFIGKFNSVFIFYSGSFGLFLLYCMTYKYPSIWIRFHVLFHLLVIYMKLFVIKNISDVKNNLICEDF